MCNSCWQKIKLLISWRCNSIKLLKRVKKYLDSWSLIVNHIADSFIVNFQKLCSRMDICYGDFFFPKNNHKNPFVLAFFACDWSVSKSQLILLWKCFIVKLIFFKGMLLLLLLLSAVGVAVSEQCEADREYHSGC